MDEEQREFEALLSAAELLLADVQNELVALDRRQRELQNVVNAYQAKLVGRNGLSRQSEVSRAVPSEMPTIDLPLGGILPEENDAEEADDQYGAITSAVTEIMTEFGKKVNAPFLASQLKMRQVPIRAKSYDRAVRTAIRRLHDKGKIKRVGTGYYRMLKAAEHVHD